MSQQEPRSQSKCPKFVLQAELERGLCNPRSLSWIKDLEIESSGMEEEDGDMIGEEERKPASLPGPSVMPRKGAEHSVGPHSPDGWRVSPSFWCWQASWYPLESGGWGVHVLPPGVLPGAAPCPQSPSVPLGNIPSDYSVSLAL